MQAVTWCTKLPAPSLVPPGKTTWRHQCRFYYKANDGVLPRRDSRRVLSAARRDLTKPSSGSSKRVLLPPFVSPGELRILLGIDYKSALALSQVKLYQQKYFWRDSEGRSFETANKRKVLVPFSLISHPIRLFGMEPILVDPEPQIDISSSVTDPSIPVVSLIGVSIQGQSHVYGSTQEFAGQKITLLPLSAKSPRSVIGRTVSHADLIVATDETRFEIEGLIEKLPNPPRLVSVDPSTLLTEDFICENLTRRPQSGPVACPFALEFRKETKRTDILVDAHKTPSSWSVILDVEKSMQQGTCALILVKSGTIRIGSYFVAGSGFGKVITMFCASSGAPLQFATPGMVVRVGRLIRNEEYTGDFAPDDNLFVFASRERAWRLAFHRQRIEWLNSFQTDGPPLGQFGFEMDSSVSKAPIPDRTNDVNAEKSVQFGGTPFEERFSEYLENGSILVPPFNAQAAAESAKVETRWKQRQDARIAAKKEAMASAAIEKKQMHELRQLIHKGSIDEMKRSLEDKRPIEVAEPLPIAKPVIPVIVKTKSVSQFDAVLDELELLEKEFGVKVPVVHGGIGPVCPTDVVHAEIESKFGPCSIYSLDVEALPECQSNTGIDVVDTESVDDLIGHVRVRIANLKRRSGRNAYMKKLKRIVDDS
jgi:hypothetical protein